METIRRVKWHELEEFPDYAVSDQGEIGNMKTGMMRKPSINQQGILKISLYDSHGRLVTRSVAVIVAEAFLEKPDIHFDTPIHLDGDRQNCNIENLAWRPRWFAIKYHKQFMFETFHNNPIHLVELESGRHYDSVKAACIDNGLYFQDVIKSYVEETFCFPTYQEFRHVR